MKNNKPLSDLEMFELLQAAYPEKFKDDDDKTWNDAMYFANELSGFDEMADLLGRVVMLTMPMRSGLTNKLYHCLGRVITHNGESTMIAKVKREVE